MDQKTDIKNNNIENMTPGVQTSNVVKGPKHIDYSEKSGTKDRIIEENTVVLRRKIDRKRADVNQKLWRRSTIERMGLPPPPLPPDSPPTSPVSATDNNNRLLIPLPNTSKSTEKANLFPASPTDNNRLLIPPPNTCTSKSTEKANLSPASPTDNQTSPPISSGKISRKRQSLIKRQSLPPPPLPPNSP